MLLTSFHDMFYAWLLSALPLARDIAYMVLQRCYAISSSLPAYVRVTRIDAAYAAGCHMPRYATPSRADAAGHTITTYAA